MTDQALTTATDPRELSLLKAIGFDRLAPEQRELALTIAKRYELDPFLKHLVLIEGRPYITRDGLLHVAHRSGQLDGIEVTDAEVTEYLGVKFWKARCSVYRKDMSRPFTYNGRYPTTGGNQKFAPEMAVKVAEVMALRRAFDVAAPVLEERWDSEVATAIAAVPSLAERAAAKRAELSAETPPPLAGSASESRTVANENPAGTSAEPGLSRAAFLAALKDAGIDQVAAASRAATLFPNVNPKELTDLDRGVLFHDLTQTTFAFDPAGEAEIDAALANV